MKDKVYPLTGFELSPADVEELLPDATPEELEDIATMTGDYLMESWQECLEQAVNNIKADRRMKQ